MIAETQFRSLVYFCDKLPGNGKTKRLNPATILRWINDGVRSTEGEVVKLRAVRVGGRWMSTDAWFDEFMGRLSTPTVPVEKPRAPAKRKRAAKDAGKRLRAAGA